MRERNKIILEPARSQPTCSLRRAQSICAENVTCMLLSGKKPQTSCGQRIRITNRDMRTIRKRTWTRRQKLPQRKFFPESADNAMHELNQ